jgi:hypothetical protein
MQKQKQKEEKQEKLQHNRGRKNERKRQNGFVQHLEPRACVGNDSMVFPPHIRSVKKEKK